MAPETQQEDEDDFMLPESQFVAETRTTDAFYDLVPDDDYFTEEFPREDVAHATSEKEESGLPVEGGRGKRTRKPTEKAKELEESPVKKRRSAAEEAFSVSESKKPAAKGRKSTARTSGGLEAEEAVEDKEPSKPEGEGRTGRSGEVVEETEAVEELEPVKKAAKGRKSNARKSAAVDVSEDAEDMELGKPAAKGRKSNARKSGVVNVLEDAEDMKLGKPAVKGRKSTSGKSAVVEALDDAEDIELGKPAAKGRKSIVEKSEVVEALEDATQVDSEKPEVSKGVVEDMEDAEETEPVKQAANYRISPANKSKVVKVRRVSVEVTRVSVEPDISGKRIRKPTEKAKELEESPAKKSRKRSAAKEVREDDDSAELFEPVPEVRKRTSRNSGVPEARDAAGSLELVEPVAKARRSGANRSSLVEPEIVDPAAQERRSPVKIVEASESAWEPELVKPSKRGRKSGAGKCEPEAIAEPKERVVPEAALESSTAETIEPKKLASRGRRGAALKSVMIEPAPAEESRAVGRKGRRKSVARIEDDPNEKEDVALNPEESQKNTLKPIEEFAKKVAGALEEVVTQEAGVDLIKGVKKGRKNNVTEMLNKSISDFEDKKLSKPRSRRQTKKEETVTLKCDEVAEDKVEQVGDVINQQLLDVPDIDLTDMNLDMVPLKRLGKRAANKTESKSKQSKQKVVTEDVEKVGSVVVKPRVRASRKLPGVASVSMMMTDSPKAEKEGQPEPEDVAEFKPRSTRGKRRGELEESVDSVEEVIKTTKSNRAAKKKATDFTAPKTELEVFGADYLATRKMSLEDFTPKSRNKMSKSPSGMDMSVDVSETPAFRAKTEDEEEAAVSKSASPQAAVSRARGRKAEPANATVAVTGRRGRAAQEVTAPQVKRGRKGKAQPELTAEVEEAETEHVEENTSRRGRPSKVAEPAVAEKQASVRSRKRAADSSPQDSPTAKRHSSASSSESLACSSPSLRGGLARRHKVMFTGFISDKDSALVEELGGALTEDTAECSVLVADTMKRTAKLLCMAARGVPIVSNRWLGESRAARRFLEPWGFIIRDPAVEKKWGCRLEDTLKQAARNKLLAGDC